MSAFVPFPEGPRDMEVTTLTPNKVPLLSFSILLQLISNSKKILT